MTLTDIEPAARDFPAAEWVRDLVFLDARPDDGTHAPVHVTDHVLVNGVKAARRTSYPDDPTRPTLRGLRIRNDRPVIVRSNGGLAQAETIVSFTIHADDVTMPHPDGRLADPRIGDLRCLIPPLAEHPWTVETDEDGERWVAVTLQVRSVAFSAS